VRHSDTRVAAVLPGVTARTELLAEGEHLLDHLGTGGAAWLDGSGGFVTSGIVAIVHPAEAVATLRSITHDNLGTAAGVVGPRAFGALPFAGGGRMIVPARVVERDADGRLWRTEIEPSRAPTTPRAAAPRPATRYVITRSTEPDAWDANVAAVLALIESQAVEKVVLAREVVIEADEPFDVPTIVETLRATQPGCIVYADDGFVGASPELLVRRTGSEVTARPMAGTGPRADELVRSDKDGREHRLVVDAVVDALSLSCDDAVALGTAPVALTDLTHLATTITARVRDLETSALDLALALHPTPAVAGTPRATAVSAIARLEATPRDLYAGPCGWVAANGDGEFVVALRGAQIEGSRARLHAGAGIVAGSRADAEWAETQVKLEPMLRALVRP
jgi:menaquinone-specific isochorismate synthase